MSLVCYRLRGLDFVDCLFWGYHVEEQQPILTFDQKLSALIQEHHRDD